MRRSMSRVIAPRYPHLDMVLPIAQWGDAMGAGQSRETCR